MPRPGVLVNSNVPSSQPAGQHECQRVVRLNYWRSESACADPGRTARGVVLIWTPPSRRASSASLSIAAQIEAGRHDRVVRLLRPRRAVIDDSGQAAAVAEQSSRVVPCRGENRACASMAAGVAAAARFEQKPASPLRFVDPHLDQAGRRDVTTLLADVVRLAQPRRQRLVVLAELPEHV